MKNNKLILGVLISLSLMPTFVRAQEVPPPQPAHIGTVPVNTAVPNDEVIWDALDNVPVIEAPIAPHSGVQGAGYKSVGRLICSYMTTDEGVTTYNCRLSQGGQVIGNAAPPTPGF